MPHIKNYKCLVIYVFLFCLFAFTPLRANANNKTSLAKIKVADLEFRLFSQSSNHLAPEYALDIKANKTRGKAQELPQPIVFAVNNPMRLVVDIPGRSSQKARKVQIRDSVIKSIRTGIHKDKIRIVIDMNLKNEPSYELLHGKRNHYQLSFSTAENKRSSINKRTIPTPPTNTPLLAPTSKPTPLTIGTQKADPAPTPKQTHPVEKAALNSIGFKLIGAKNDPSVILKLSKIEKYSLVRIDQNLYELSILNTTIAKEDLLLPSFPPESYTGLELVSVREKGNNLLIRIYVGDLAKLKTYSKDNIILVRVIPQEKKPKENKKEKK